MGCGYEARSELVQVRPWQPPAGKAGYSGPNLETCAGYTTALPAVSEVMRARAFFEKGELATWLRGELATEQLLDALLILVGSTNDVQRWCMTPSKDGGGAE